MTYVDYPYQIGSDGRTALTVEGDHIRDLIEQVLFTAPGERVNRPSFGSGVMQLVFAGQDDGLAHATQTMVQGALQQWLGDLIEVQAVQVASAEAQLNVTVQYIVRRTQRPDTALFTREV